jgi:outer membrane protein OmpA-like peptidoglycan-associated protein
VCNYDYTRAKRLLRQINKEGDGIYLVSYLVSLSNVDEASDKDLLFVDLSYATEDLVEGFMLEFRNQVSKIDYANGYNPRLMLLHFRSYLANVADWSGVSFINNPVEIIKDVLADSGLLPSSSGAVDGLNEKTFVIYFDLGSAQLTEPSRETIDEAASYALDLQIIYITVSGHADRSGSEDGNLSISKKRSRNVLRALADAGVPPGFMKSKWFGEDQPALDTLDGESERLNRRVEINVRQSEC